MTDQAHDVREFAIDHVAVAGGGILGSQIAFHVAFKGIAVSLYDIDEASITKAKELCAQLPRAYAADLKADQAELNAALDRITFTNDLGEAAGNADLVIEAVPERLDIKRQFYADLSKVASKTAIFASNSSTLVPSQLAEISGRPDRYLHLHFSNRIWKHNTAEIMGSALTDREVFNTVVAFSKRIGMVALPIHKEHPGYIGNALLMPLLAAALDLAANDVADIASIDKNWMINRETPFGPFGMLDYIGLPTAFHIASATHTANPTPRSARVVEYLEKNFLATGKLGAASGEGFYTYPNPAYVRPDFLS